MPAKVPAPSNPAVMSADPSVNEDGSVSLPVGAVSLIDHTSYEWETVHTEAATQLTFNEVGDTFIGLYIGQETVEFTDKRGLEQDFTQLNFLVGDEPFAINAGYDLVRGFKGIQPSTVVRIQLRKLVDVGQQSPLKSYRVDVAGKASGGAGASPNPVSEAIARRVHDLKDTQDTPLTDEPPF
jgi:hypothetical protein